MNFNSTMVRLGEILKMLKIRFVLYFNSTMVRLGANISAFTWSRIISISIPLWFDWELHNIFILQVGSLFQFHYGSIGRKLTDQDLGKLILFQFHYGSIGRIENYTSQVRLFYFNSTMVRLGAYPGSPY